MSFFNFNDWCERLIYVIKSRPALYDQNMSEYHDINFKDKLWIEVYREVIQDWDKLDRTQKLTGEKEIQNRWQNLKTCFTKELEFQKRGPSTVQEATKHKEYLYFQQLQFLLPYIQDREPATNVTDELNVTGITETEDDPHLIALRKTKIRKKETAYEEHITNNPKEEIDEEKSFVLSIVPSLKQLNEDQKLEAKTEILRIIRKIQVTGTLNPYIFLNSQFPKFNPNISPVSNYLPPYLPGLNPLRYPHGSYPPHSSYISDTPSSSGLNKQSTSLPPSNT